MRNSIKRLPVILTGIFSIALIFSSCKKDNDNDMVNPLPVAVIDVVSTASPLDTIYVDGSASTNATNFEWEITGPNVGNYFVSDPVLPSKGYFVASQNGSYQVRLRVTNQSNFAEAQNQVIVSGGVQIGGTLTQSMTLTNLGYDLCEYFITEDLIIPSGVTLMIDGDVDICVAEGVAIIVEGRMETTSSTTVGISAAGTNWKGIYFKENSSAILRGVIIDGAGSASFSSDPDEKAAIYMEGRIQACQYITVKNSAGYGIVMSEGAKIESDFYTVFENNASGAGIFNLNTLATYGGGFQLLGETPSTYLKVRGGSALASHWQVQKFPSPYLILGDITIDRMTVVGGVEMYFTDGTGLEVKGDLQAAGSSGSMVAFEGVTKIAGSWKGVYVGGSCILDNTSVKYAGSSPWTTVNDGDFSGAVVAEGFLRLKNSNLSHNMGYGLVSLFYNGPTPSDYQNNDISSNTSGAIVTSKIAFVDNYANAVGSIFDGYGSQPIITILGGGNVSDVMGTWTKISPALSSTDYKLMNDGNAYGLSSNWVIESGVKIECDAGVKIRIASPRTLDAQGTSSEPIQFVGSSSSAGYWDGLYADFNSIIKLDYVTINFGGGGTGSYKGCLNVENSINTTNSFVTNCTFLNGGTYDLYFPSNSDVLDIKNIINNNIFSTSN